MTEPSTPAFEWCVRSEMKGEWRNGIAVDHAYLKLTAVKVKMCPRCGVRIRD